MENKMEIFKNEELGQVRVVEENGKVLFCGTDIATALGYTNPRKAVRDHTRGVTKRSIGVETGKKADGTPAMQMVEMSFVPEGDVYRLITHSKLPAAEKFESWVFDEVLPTIRKYGTYMLPDVLQKATEDKEYCGHLLSLLNDDMRRKNIVTRETAASDSVYKEWSGTVITPALLQLQTYHPKYTTKELLGALYNALKAYYDIDVSAVYFDFVNREMAKARELGVTSVESEFYVPKLYVLYLDKMYRAALVSQLYSFLHIELLKESEGDMQWQV